MGITIIDIVFFNIVIYLLNFLPLAETIQTAISFLSVLVVLGVFIVEKKVHRKR
jgi:hypothetical protein